MSEITIRLRDGVDPTDICEAEEAMDRGAAEIECLRTKADALRERNRILETAHQQLQRTLDERCARVAELEYSIEVGDAVHQKLRDLRVEDNRLLKEATNRAERAEADLANTKAQLRHMHTFDNQHRGKIAKLEADLAEARMIIKCLMQPYVARTTVDAARAFLERTGPSAAPAIHNPPSDE